MNALFPPAKKIALVFSGSRLSTRAGPRTLSFSKLSGLSVRALIRRPWVQSLTSSLNSIVLLSFFTCHKGCLWFSLFLSFHTKILAMESTEIFPLRKCLLLQYIIAPVLLVIFFKVCELETILSYFANDHWNQSSARAYCQGWRRMELDSDSSS